MIDPAKLARLRPLMPRHTDPRGLGCFGCGKRLGPGNWYGLCLQCVARVPKAQRAEFHERHMERKARAT